MAIVPEELEEEKRRKINKETPRERYGDK